MICPRVLTSYTDALFCCHFVRLMIRLKTPGFQLLDFYNNWTIMLTQCIRCCSERESQIFGVFLRELMSYVCFLRRGEETYKKETEGNPVFYRNYYEDPAAADIEWSQFTDIKKGHAKWEGRIFKAMKQGLDSEDWMEKRNALLLLSACYESYPIVEKYANATLKLVEAMRDKEELSDIKTLAGSIVLKLKNQKDRWLDKLPTQPESSRRTEGSSKAKNSLAIEKHKSDAKASDRRSPRKEDGKRPAGSEQDHSSEKRSRRDGDEDRKDKG